MPYLAVCAIFRDESPYLAEWLTHYELQGVERFYLYDDRSADDPEHVLRPWLDRGRVVLERVPPRNRRKQYAYEHCLAAHRGDSRWIAFLDIDEFAFPGAAAGTLADVLTRFEDVPGLGVNSLCYGSSDFDRPPGPLVCTNYQLRARLSLRTSERLFLREDLPEGHAERQRPLQTLVKSIVRADTVEGVQSPHGFFYRNGATAVSPGGAPIAGSPLAAFSREVETDILRINHYWSKSRPEFRRKLERRRVDTDAFYGEDTAFLREAAMNQEYDPAILPHSRAVAQRLGVAFDPGTPAEWRARESLQQARDINAEAREFADGVRRRDIEKARAVTRTATRAGRTIHYLTVCAIFRDEARYLAEWMAHHELQGVEHFYLYDDQSVDRPEQVLQPWIDRGRVTLERLLPGTRRQRYAYERCLIRHRRDARWIAFLDIDEFAFACNRPESLAEIMTRFERFPGLGINWLCYGSSGFEAPPGRLVCSSYQLRGRMNFRTMEHIFLKAGQPAGQLDSYWPYNAHIKSIVRTDAVEGMLSPHSFMYRNKEPAVSPSGTPIPDSPLAAFSERVETGVLRINHYWSKSLSEFRRKLARRRADIDLHNQLNVSILREAAMNREYDPAILGQCRAVADRLGVPFTPGEPAEWAAREAFQQGRDINAEIAGLIGEWEARLRADVSGHDARDRPAGDAACARLA